MRARELALAAALIAGAAGCLHNPDPRPRSMTTVPSDTHGSYAVLVATGQPSIAGELIAIGPADVWILSGDRLVQTPLERVTSLELFPYEVQTGPVVAWGILGTLSTISHGVFLIFSAPVWLLTSSITGAMYSRTPHVEYTAGNWQELVPWARFPQGLPPGVTAGQLLHGQAPPGGLGPPSTVQPYGPPSSAPAPTTPPAPAPPAPPQQLYGLCSPATNALVMDQTGCATPPLRLISNP
jgi:hypothetical protein